MKLLAADEKKYKRYAVLLIGLVTFYHLLIIGMVGPGDNEAYYWTWSKHLDLSYYDHPPMIVYMIALTTAIGGDSIFFLRLGAVIIFCFTSYLIYLLALDLFGKGKTAFYSLCLANIVPLFYFIGILTIPDAPLTFFWLLYLYLLLKVAKGVPWWHWYLMGFVLGLAFLSKYFAVLLVPSTIFFLASDKKLRSLLKSFHPSAALLLSILVASPVLLWNMREGWASLVYHLNTRHEGSLFLDNLWSLFSGQVGAVTPLLLISLIVTLLIFMKQALKPDGTMASKFIVWTSVPTLFFFFVVMCLTSEAEPHWPALGYLPLVIGAVCLYPQMLEKKRNLKLRFLSRKVSAKDFVRWWLRGPLAFKIFVWMALLIPLAFILLLNVHLFYPLYRPALFNRGHPTDLTGWEVAEHDATGDLFGWGEVAERIRQIRVDMNQEGEAPFVFSFHFNVSSQLSFALKDAEAVFCLSSALDQFDFWQNTDELFGKNAVYVCTNRYPLLPQEGYKFDRIEGPETVITRRAGDYIVREHYIYRCYGFKGLKE